MAQQKITSRFYAYISGTWTLLLDIAPITGSRGLANNDPETRIADIGDISLSLNNSTGIYTPGVTAGWKLGTLIKWVLTYDNKDYIKFRGAIDTISMEQNPGDKIVKITALDWLDYASKYPVINPDLLEEVTADFAIQSISQSMPVQPQATNLDIGNIVYPTVFDTVRGGTKAYEEISKIVNSETGYAYLHTTPSTGEELVFESLDFRNGTRTQTQFPKLDADCNVRLTTTGDVRLTTTGDTRITSDNQAAIFNDGFLSVDVEYGKKIINRFTSNAYPKRTDTYPQNIYSTERPLYLASGESKTVRVFWADPTGKRPINARPPNVTSDVKALCHFDTQIGNDYPDESGKLWVAVDAPLVTNVVKYGLGAAYLDGTGSYLYSADSPDWDFGSGDFTVEWYEHRFSNTINACAIARDGTSAYPPFLFGWSDTTDLYALTSLTGAAWDLTMSLGPITLNTWNHFAVSRSGNNFYTFKNGVLIAQGISSGTLLASSNPISIGRYFVSGILTACIDDVRITKGAAVYTASFNAPSAPLTIYGTFFSMWTGINNTGTEITNSLISSVDYGTEGAVFALENNSTTGGYLNINVYGYGIYSDSALQDTQENSDSINSFSQQNQTLQQAYQQDTAIGALEGKRVVELYNQPRTILNSISMFANTSSYNMLAFLNLDIGDMVRINITKHNIDAMYYIQGVNYSLNGGLISFTWIVKEAFTLGLGLSPLAVEFAGGTATDAINFEYMPIVSADEVYKRAFSAWVYLDAVGATSTQAIFSTASNQSGGYLFVQPQATKVILRYIHKGFATNFGQWSTPDNPFAVGGWAHIFLAYDRSSASNDPIIYIDGVKQVLTEIDTPSGASVSEEGHSLVIGNGKWPTKVNYDVCFNGKIKDVRVYNMNKTSRTIHDLAVGLEAEGAGGSGYYEGMVFNAFACRTADLTAYTDLTLTTEKVLEAYNGYVGTANGSPVTRLP